MPEQIPWEKIPFEIKHIVTKYCHPLQDWDKVANEIMQAMKAEQEKSFNRGKNLGVSLFKRRF
jgi:hypothetical protein